MMNQAVTQITEAANTDESSSEVRNYLHQPHTFTTWYGTRLFYRA